MASHNRESQHRPIIAISMGEPAGIGAEVIVKALADPELRAQGRFVIFGIHELLEYATARAEIEVFWQRVPQSLARDLRSYAHDVVVLDYDEFSGAGPGLLEAGATKLGGDASLRFVMDALDAVVRGGAGAMVTGPICKLSWQMAGVKWPGHTDLLAHHLKTRRYAMMFLAGSLRVTLATIHTPLFEVRNQFNIGCVFRPIELTHQALTQWFGMDSPRIGVAGINPHAGEDGLLGDEEKRIISPAITMACEAGYDAVGPFPADTLFYRAANGEFDAVIAMYHDQALIPVKLLAFDRAVNLTLGLPIVRTSCDHGTAFDLVGRNRAEPGSMKSALLLACQLARRRQAFPARHKPRKK